MCIFKRQTHIIDWQSEKYQTVAKQLIKNAKKSDILKSRTHLFPVIIQLPIIGDYFFR